MAVVDFAYGSLYGPVVETDKTDMETLAYGSLYGPVVGVESGAPPATGNIKTINGTAWANIKTINGVALANVKTVMGVT